tara:strand:- start:376 stop:813 length:438 start_codon:yes stop_codon:yes gene_type:complete
MPKEIKKIICDIDGTIADNTHRQSLLSNKNNWDEFFLEMRNDLPIYPVINKVIDEFRNGKEIIFLTGRPLNYEKETNEWLKKYFTFEYRLIMRNENDRRNKLIVKKELFFNNFSVSEIDYVIDNDAELLQQWKEIGLRALDAIDV